MLLHYLSEIDLHDIHTSELGTGWLVFNFVILTLIVVDMFVIRRNTHEMKLRRAVLRSGFWVALAIAYWGGIHYWLGTEKGLQFFTGYVIEMSMSVDNIFIFILLFRYFNVPKEMRHRVLAWGVFGAIVFRGLFILVGVSLIERFHVFIYVFGVMLVWSAVQIARSLEAQVDPEKNFVLKALRPRLRVTESFEGLAFFVKREDSTWVTPLFIALLAIETTDILFAVDSIPAVLAISRDIFIVFTSNIFAVLGLRALYFALEGMMQKFHLLHYGLAAVLSFVGVKMLISGYYEIPIHISLMVIALVLILSVFTSILIPAKEDAEC